MSIDISHLLTQLNNTGLQNKNNPLYQFLNQLLGALRNVSSASVASVTNNTTNVTTVLGSPTQLFWDDISSDESFISSPSSPIPSSIIGIASPVQLFWDDSPSEEMFISTPISNTITGTGTSGKLPKWASSSSLTDSIAQESAGQIGIGGSPNDTLDVKGLFRISGQSGQPNYARFDNTTNAGKIWRFGNTGAGPATSFDIFNQTDNIVAISFASATGIAATYANKATVGFGVPAIYSTARLTGQTTVPVTLLTFNMPSTDGSYLVTGITTITAFTSGSVALRIDWTDEGGNANSGFLPNNQAIGQGAGVSAIIQLRAKASTTITATLVNRLGGGFNITYNAEVWIMQIG